MSVTATEPLIASGPVLLALDGAVARLRLNRPEASNGLDVPLLRALHDAVLRCHSDPRVRAVLLSGEGKHFCAGGDVRTFASKGERLPEYLREATAWLQASARTEGAPGQQLSYFRAFTTLDQAGTLEVPVPRICVRAVGHEVQERCAENVSSVELVERVQGLVGIGDRCVETLASANTSEGALTATARACP